MGQPRACRMKVIKGLIGLISDTHGLMRPQAMDALEGVEMILHAGDIGKPEVLASLRTIAPVVAIKGNNDAGTWANRLPSVLNLEINGVKIHVIHDVREVPEAVRAAGFHVVVSGHSHKPSVRELDGLYWINPGSAGPRRFKLPVTVGRLTLKGTHINAAIIELI